jgi:alkyldihydroxyacetonephosphate synthase
VTRSWWGWGDADAAVAGSELDGLGALVAAQFAGVAPQPVAVPDPRAVPLPAPRIALPAPLATLGGADHVDRLRHAHGQAYRDVVRALHGDLPTAPDLVVRPSTPAEVAAVLDWASDAHVAVVPFGGGTSVVGGVEPAAGPCISLDLERLDRVREVDPVSQAAHVEAGALGPQIDAQLKPHGFALRHYPQSWEYSTLGGWIATRAGGHYATRWTHIDDLVEAVGAETPCGRWESCRLPGSGAGPSPDRLLLGSEGSLGVVTDAWVRIQPRPEFRAQADVRFPSFLAGATALRALAQSGLEPANCRLLDPVEAALAGAGDGTHAVLVLGFESADHPLGPWIDRALEIVRDHGGVSPDGPRLRAGDRTGEGEGATAAWRRTFLRAPYLRDALVRLGVIVETFETAITWDRFDSSVTTVVTATEAAVTQVCGAGSVSVRVTHAYPDGAAPYVTVLAPGRRGSEVAMWDEIKAAAAEAILAAGGTITHHHAVGRVHAPWYERQRPGPFGHALAAAKQAVDPAGILNPGVLGLGVAAG